MVFSLFLDHNFKEEQESFREHVASGGAPCKRKAVDRSDAYCAKQRLDHNDVRYSSVMTTSNKKVR